MATNGFQGSYANEGPPSSQGSASGDVDAANDPASSGFFVNDYKRHEDLKQMLDTNKDSLKLEAMKRIIGMVAKGKDASDLFPAVVKNVVSKNIEVKKLVYVYLTRYAEEQQDLALLSISTFQRALKDPNQLIRASALRVLSSIRVHMIVPIMMLAIKESVMDMSPYVRKTAAHAIPKLYSIDPEQKDLLIEVIEKLLGDKTTLVAGSAIQAFEEVCPERIDLIHKNYRKLCNLLVDVDEWGQVAIINMLTRYCRTQFVNPNQDDMLEECSERAFYASSQSSKDDEDDEDDDKPRKKPYIMDADHRLLLRNAKPLLNSRNGSVVMAVAQLYHHCAPRGEVSLVAKALIRLLRSHKEVQFVVLSNIASMSVNRKDMFEPLLKSFYVRSSDPIQVKLLKLEILTNLATETNISTMLREFQTYVTSSDQEFAAATIQAIGRCASSITEITDQCLTGLCSLLSNRNEAVVGESVVVIKKLLQMQSSEHKDIIIHLARLVEDITVPLAKASILWLIGEYSDRVPKIAPDVLRKMAKTFTDEEDIVKLQIINLAAKLCITNSKQTKLLCQYVFNLAKYDQNYDIRDRTRLLRQLILPGDKASVLAKHAKKIFLSTKPAPVIQSKFKERDQYQLSTLSHVINARAHGYQEIPDWPEAAPDPDVRNVEVAKPWPETKRTKLHQDKKKSFYSSGDGSTTTEGADSTQSSSDDETDTSSGDSASSSTSDSDSSSSDSDTQAKALNKKKKKEVPVADLMSDLTIANTVGIDTAGDQSKTAHAPKSDESEASSSNSSSSSSDSESSSEEEVVKLKKPVKAKAKSEKVEKTKPKAKEPEKPSANLLDLDDFGPSMPASIMTPGGFLAPTASIQHIEPKAKPNYEVIGTSFSPQTQHELLNKFAGAGLSATYRFTRTVSIFSPKMISVELVFINNSDEQVQNIKIVDKKLRNGMELHEFPEIPALVPGGTAAVIMAIDFNDTTQAAQFSISTQEKKFPVQIVAPVGELLQPNTMTGADFTVMQGKLTGMTENSTTLTLTTCDAQFIGKAIQQAANVLQVPSGDHNTYHFAGKTVSSGTDLLVSVKVTDAKAKLTVNCEKMVIGSMLLRDIKHNLLS